jgi:hypothetical protein
VDLIAKWINHWINDQQGGSSFEPEVVDPRMPYSTNRNPLIPITLLWISSLMMSLSPQAVHRSAGLDSYSSPKLSFAPMKAVQRYRQFEFGVDPTFRLRSRRDLMIALLLSISSEYSQNEQK